MKLENPRLAESKLMKQSIGILAFGFAILAAVSADDWPAYRHDAQRSGISDEELLFPLNVAWTHTAAQPPAPAWAEPGVEMNRLDFDYAFQPVVSDGFLYYASSADNTVRALDLDSGETVWRFTADGPIRFAPQISDRRCYFASDDGVVYCLDGRTGKPAWSTRVAFNHRQVVGNAKLISRWPCRAGVLVDGGVVYTTAGMWPSEGVFVFALDAETGKDVWCNDTCGGLFMQYPHGGSLAIGGVAPQGYLLATNDTLLSPTGRSIPAAFDRKDGRLLHYLVGDNRANGGWRASIAGNNYYSPAHGGKWPMSGKWEPFGPRPGDGIKRFDVTTGASDFTLPERHFVIGTGSILYAAGNGAIEARKGDAVVWSTETSRVFEMVRAGNALIVGGRNEVSAVSLTDGSLLWSEDVQGEARGLAIASQRLFVSTHKGIIHSFAAGEFRERADERSVWKSADDLATNDSAIPGVDLTRLNRGLALVIGDVDDGVVNTILKFTGLRIALLLTDVESVQQKRDHYLSTTNLYGSRITVSHFPSSSKLPHPDFAFNLIVVGNGAPVQFDELYRALRPCGGIMSAGSKDALKAFATQMTNTSEYRIEEGGSVVVRGKLPGAFDWDSQTTSDKRLRWPLELTWFGGPGPSKMANRHRAFMPTAANGRYFAVGNHHLMAVDAYNGFELWEKEIKSLAFNLGQLIADDDTVYVHLGNRCLALDAQTGRQKTVYIKKGKPAAGESPWASLPAHAIVSRALPTPVPAGKREHPLTGDRASKAYKRAYGCGSVISSSGMHFFRSATLGMYDLEDDSGLRNFSGIRPACALSMVPALGLLIANEGSGGCVCSYNFQTSLALAPAHESKHEDWAVFYDSPTQSITGHLALNLGAPGDRRDANRALWLGIPRPKTGLRVPCEVTFLDGFGFDRKNADRTPIAGTTDPWIYTSAAIGIKSLTLNLESFGNIVSLNTPSVPTIDGSLNDKCWDGQFPLPVTDETSKVYLRHDSENLYLGFRRPAAVDRRGNMTPWKRALNGQDAPVWEDDSCEVAITDTKKQACVHLGMSASGARYDGLWAHADPYPAFDIPMLDNVKIDGTDDDWSGRGFKVLGLADKQGHMRLPKNLDPKLIIGWNERGLLLYVDVTDNAVIEYPAQASMWSKDSIELFMAENRESNNRFHLCIGPGADGKQPKARAFFWDRRSDKTGVPLSVDVVGRRTATGYAVEMLLPWSNLQFRPEPGKETALQVLVNDSDQVQPSSKDWFRVSWHPDGHSGFKPAALHRLTLTDRASPPVKLRRASTKPDRKGLVKSIPAVSIPSVEIPRLDSVTIDGNLDDWADKGFHQVSLAGQDATMRSAENFDPSFRLAWDERGVLVAADVKDQAVIIDEDTSKLWRKDSVEIFMSASVGTRESFQIFVGPGTGDAQNPPRMHSEDSRVKFKSTGPLDIHVRSLKKEGGYTLEALLPWKNLGIKPAVGLDFGLQLFFNDADDTRPYPGDWFRVAWYPVGHAGWNPLAFHRVKLALAPTTAIEFKRGGRVNDDLVRAAEPYPWPMPGALKGMTGENSHWTAPWTGSSKADDKAFVCEIAVPWKTLEAEGIDTKNLLIDFSHRGRIETRPSWSFMPIDVRKTAERPAQPYTVRLHFAELKHSTPGERVFDVKLQEKTVLKSFDTAKNAEGTDAAIVKEFTGVMAGNRIHIECVPAKDIHTWRSVPILNAIEIVPEARD